MENRLLKSILNQNKELISKLDDSTSKNSLLEEIIFVVNQCVIEKPKRGKTLHDQIKCLKNEKFELSDKVHYFENNYFDVV